MNCSVYCWKKIIIYVFLRVCKSNVYSVSDLDYLFSCLIISLFTYCIRDWGVVAYTKYLSQIDRPLRRGFRFGFIQHEISIQQVTKDTHLMLWKVLWVLPRIPCRIFSPLLNVRSRSHPDEVPCVNTDRLKKCFVIHVLIELVLLKIKAFSLWFVQTHSNVVRGLYTCQVSRLPASKTSI